jgi:hypothetical protein
VRSALRFALVLAAVAASTLLPVTVAPASASALAKTAAVNPAWWTQAVPETATDKVVRAEAAGEPIDGGFTKTYGWGVPSSQVTVHHAPAVTPLLVGADINHFFDKPFMRAVFQFEGGLPTYRFQYVSEADAEGCTRTDLTGRRFLRITFLPADSSGRPIGEVLLVEEGAVVTMAQVCGAQQRAKFGFGLTNRVVVRTGESMWTDPDGNVRHLVALDFHDFRRA